MRLTVNGEHLKVDKQTLRKLLETFNIADQEKGIAVAVNDTVITKDKWDSYKLEKDDRIEIIRATQGG